MYGTIYTATLRVGPRNGKLVYNRNITVMTPNMGAQLVSPGYLPSISSKTENNRST
jgi:hypothetical protein